MCFFYNLFGFWFTRNAKLRREIKCLCFQGASILNMIMGIMGRDDFYVALRNYLEKYKLKNVVHEDLLEEFTKVALPHHETNLTDDMNNWVVKNGYPVVTLSLDNTTGVISYKQKRYLLRWNNATSGTPSFDDHIWHIPLNIQRMGGKSVEDLHTNYCWIRNRQGK